MMAGDQVTALELEVAAARDAIMEVDMKLPKLEQEKKLGEIDLDHMVASRGSPTRSQAAILNVQNAGACFAARDFTTLATQSEVERSTTGSCLPRVAATSGMQRQGDGICLGASWR